MLDNTYRLLFPYEENFDIDKKHIKNVEVIYEHLMDNISKTIYQGRIMAALTGDATYMRDVILTVPENKNLISNLERKRVFIYGAGIRGKRWEKVFPEILVGGGYIDEKSDYEKKLGVSIFKPSDYIFREGDIVIVSPLFGYDEIKRELTVKGIPEDRILCQGMIDAKLYENQYFDQEILSEFDKGAVFVDCGCFDGNDSIKFALNCKDRKFSKIYAFEPNKKNYITCNQVLTKFPNVKLFNLALGDEAKELKLSGENSDSRINNEVGKKVNVVKLDEVINGTKVDYIKMDLEGYEEKALIGASEIIKVYKPILAVSIYHKRWDIFRIPEFILELNANYKFYLRHYGSSFAETVLYAI